MAGESSSSRGTSSRRTRTRANRGSRFDGSAAEGRPWRARCARTSALRARSSGRTSWIGPDGVRVEAAPGEAPTGSGRARRQHGEPARACAAEEAEQQRLGAIVGGVARRDRRARPPPRRRARAPRGGRRARGPAGSRRARPSPRVTAKGTPSGSASRAGDVELGGGAWRAGRDRRRAPAAACPSRLAQEGEHVQERRRVGPARAGAEHDVARGRTGARRGRGARRGEGARAGASGRTG